MKTIPITNFESRVEPQLKWDKIEDIPDFPFSNFDDVKYRIGTNEYVIGIDFTTSNKFAESFYGKAHMWFFLVLASAPVIVVVISILSAIVLKNYWLLVGLVLGFIAQFMSNPYNPLKDYLKPIVGLLFLTFVYGVWQNKETMAFLSAFFIFPFFLNSFLYSMNQNKLKAVALSSEKIFIYLYQLGKLGLKDTTSGQSYWYSEV